MTDDELKGLFEGLREDNAAVRGDVGALRQDVTALREDGAAWRGEFAGLRQDVTTLREDGVAVRGEFAGLRQDNLAMREEFAALRQDNATIRQELATANAETRRYFEEVAERMESKFNALAEMVVAIKGSIDRRIDGVEETIKLTAAETQAMMKFSHAELDRRIRTLEDTQQALKDNQRALEGTLSDLLARVGRLETTTH
jgi:chromosome segregation ATPase